MEDFFFEDKFVESEFLKPFLEINFIMMYFVLFMLGMGGKCTTEYITNFLKDFGAEYKVFPEPRFLSKLLILT